MNESILHIDQPFDTANNYYVNPADVTAVDIPVVVTTANAMAEDIYEPLGAVGGERDSRIYAKLQTPKATDSENVPMDNIGKSRGADNQVCGHPDVAIAGKETELSVEDDYAKQQALQTPNSTYETLDKTSRSPSGEDHEYGRLDVAIAGKERAPSADKNSQVYAVQQAQKSPDSAYESLNKTSRSRSADDHEYGRLDVATAGKGRASSVHKGQRSGKRRPSSKDRYVDMPRRMATDVPDRDSSYEPLGQRPPPASDPLYTRLS